MRTSRSSCEFTNEEVEFFKLVLGLLVKADEARDIDEAKRAVACALCELEDAGSFQPRAMVKKRSGKWQGEML